MIYLDKFIDNAFRNAMYGDVFTTSTGYKDLVRDEKEKAEITLAVPGLSKNDIEIEVKEEGMLTLIFKKENDFFKTNQRSWALPEDIDVENISAECKNGVLVVTLPKTKKTPMTRKVKIV